MDLCKTPEVACEATLGPIEDFGFDAAILFSDLLFPLEAMGMGLHYDEGPKLDWHIRSKTDLKQLKGGAQLASHLKFQAEAMQMIRKKLAPEKGLLGFVGGPLTLFFYAVEGTHQGASASDLASARTGLLDGRFEGFCERLLPLLAENMALQARAGADTVAILDTCAGEIDLGIYAAQVKPTLSALLERFQRLCPHTPITYYSKGTGSDHWAELTNLPIACLGIDWNSDLANSLVRWGDRFAIQGNIDPKWLLLDAIELEIKLRDAFMKVKALPSTARKGWICGLGHGVLPKTPESNIRLFLKLQKELFE